MKKKKCFKCKEVKPISEYYVHKQMGDGYLGKCKKCTKNDATSHRWNNIEKIRKYDRGRGKLPHRIMLNVENTKLWRKKFPKKYAAYGLLSNALRKGKVKKPNQCTKCKKENARLEAHHDDYNKPLDVVWLCVPCHRHLHRDLRNLKEG